MGDETIRIERLAFEGDGIGHLADGKVVFVPNTCPGDRVRIAIREDKGSFARGKVLEMLEESPDRVPLACHNDCNACPWQHIQYQTQLEWKRSFVSDALERIGGLGKVTVRECVPSKPWGVRNKLELEVLRKDGRLDLGLHAPSFSPIDHCPMAEKQIAGSPKALKGALRFLDGRESLDIDRVGIRSSARTKDIEVVLWTKPGPFPRKTVGKVLQDAVKASSVTRVMYKEKVQARKVTGVEVLWGKGFWREKLAGEILMVSSPSFFQVNTAGAESLIELALSYLDLSGSERVADLYSGIGTFTIPLAKLCDEVVAVEMEGSSIRDLRRNLENLGLPAEAVGGDVARELPELGHFDATIIDPPRSGLSAEALDALLLDPPDKLVYVSCNPATLARDVKRLCNGFYRLEEATPLDMFPQTFHVETVVLMTRTE